MGFLDSVKAALRGIVNGPGSEAIVYYPLGNLGAPVNIRALVNRSPREVDAGEIYGQTVDLLIANDATVGVTAVAPKKDLVDVVMVEGEAPARARVVELIADGSSPAHWHVVAVRR